MQEQELFQQYELKGWQLSPHLYKIIGASVIINIIAFFSMAQANFLTGKTCDSPIASGICSVVDALYVATVLGGTDTRYTDVNYVKTELEDAEITMIDWTGQYPLEYPPGYFALANPEQQTTEIIDPTMLPPTDMNGFSNPTLPNTNNDLLSTPQVTPTPNNNAVRGVLPSNPFGGSNPTTRFKPRKEKNPTITNDPTTKPPGDETTGDVNAEKNDEVKPDEAEIVEEVKINKKVMTDYANSVKVKVDKKEVDLSQNFTVVVEGVLTKDGKLDTSIDKKTKKPKSGIVFSEGEPQILEVGKQALAAIGDSGWLGYLRNFGADNVKITLVQDDEKVFAIVESSQKTPEKARQMASGLGLLILTTKQIGKLGEDEMILLNGAQKPTADGKVFKLNFALPKKDVQDMIQRNLKKAAEANQNSTAQTENAAQKTSK